MQDDEAVLAAGQGHVAVVCGQVVSDPIADLVQVVGEGA